MNRNHDHLDTLDRLDFVHEKLPTGDSRNGSWFVLRYDFGSDQPRIRVTSDLDSTEVHVFAGYELAYSARFAPETPGAVLEAFVSAAIEDVLEVEARHADDHIAGTTLGY